MTVHPKPMTVHPKKVILHPTGAGEPPQPYDVQAPRGRGAAGAHGRHGCAGASEPGQPLWLRWGPSSGNRTLSPATPQCVGVKQGCLLAQSAAPRRACAVGGGRLRRRAPPAAFPPAAVAEPQMPLTLQLHIQSNPWENLYLENLLEVQETRPNTMRPQPWHSTSGLHARGGGLGSVENSIENSF